MRLPEINGQSHSALGKIAHQDRGIQYAATSRFHHQRSGILGRPVLSAQLRTRPGDDVGICVRDLATRCARGLQINRPRKMRAQATPRGRSAIPRGEQGRPGARCTRGLACKWTEKGAHEHTGSAEAVRPSLRNGFTAYFVLSLATGFLSPSSPRSLLLRNLTPASGRQDHTTSPSTSRAVRQKRIGVHRIPSQRS